jgi:hypothetical protein
LYNNTALEKGNMCENKVKVLKGITDLSFIAQELQQLTVSILILFLLT